MAQTVWPERVLRQQYDVAHAQAVYKDINGNIFRFEGNELVCDCYKSAFAPFRAKQVKLRIELTDEMQVEITDNAQITENTVFL